VSANRNPHLSRAPVSAGRPLDDARTACLLVHGRDQDEGVMSDVVERLRLDDVARLTASVRKVRPFIVAADWRPTRLLDRAGLGRAVAPAAEQMTAVLGNESRKGPWVVPAHRAVRSVLGDCHLEMQHAVIRQPVTTIDATVRLGSVTIFVPDGIEVRMSGRAVLGAKSSELHRAPRPGALDAADARCAVVAPDRQTGDAKRAARRRRRCARYALVHVDVAADHHRCKFRFICVRACDAADDSSLAQHRDPVRARADQRYKEFKRVTMYDQEQTRRRVRATRSGPGRCGQLLREMAQEDLSAQEIYDRIAVRDVQLAADVLRRVYDESGRHDGYVSLEVAPDVAHDADRTITAARHYWKQLNRPNTMIKIPGTPEGVRAIEHETGPLQAGLPELRATLTDIVGGAAVIAERLTAAIGLSIQATQARQRERRADLARPCGP